MPSPLEILQLLVGTVLLVLLVLIAALFVRRRVIADGKQMVLLAWRHGGKGDWRLGLLRLGTDRMDLFSIVKLSMRPRQSWRRGLLELGTARPATDTIPGIPDAVAVSAVHGSRRYEFALSPGSYTAMRAWVESSPPGVNVNVA